MTGTAPAPRDQLRQEIHEQLAEVLVEAVGSQMPRGYVWYPDRIADALIPIVERREAEAAARALEQAAEVFDYTPLSERESGRVSDYTRGWHNAAQALRAKAGNLRRERAGRAQAGERQ